MIESILKKYLGRLSEKKKTIGGVLKYDIFKQVWIPTISTRLEAHEEYTLDYVGQAMISYFCNPKKRWALFYGPKGTGKSISLKSLSDISKGIHMPSYWVYFDAKDIETRYKDEGFEFFKMICTRDNVIIDDLGNENPEYNDFGTIRNLIQDIIWARYNHFQDWGQRTMLATNLWKDQNGDNLLQDRYGDRLFDRLNECCQMIYLKGETRRK
jgi:DNA replication protein DnaC